MNPSEIFIPIGDRIFQVDCDGIFSGSEIIDSGDSQELTAFLSSLEIGQAANFTRSLVWDGKKWLENQVEIKRLS